MHDSTLPSAAPTSTAIKRRRLIVRSATTAVALAAVGVLLAGCSTSATSSSSDKADYGKLTVQLSWVKDVEFAGEYYADSKGYYKKAGFSSVNLVAGPGATESLVASGKALVGISDPVSAAPAIVNEGAPLKIIGTTYQKNPFSIVSLADKANILTAQDLVGKRIGVQAGNETLFKSLLTVNNIALKDVTIVPVEYDPSPLTSGDIDGYFGYLTNEAVTLENQGYKVANLPYADNGLPFVTESFEVTDDSIKNHRAALEAFLYATIKGWQDSNADPEGSADLAINTYGKALGLDKTKEVAQAKATLPLIESAETKANGLFTISKSLIADNIATIKASGVTITADKLFDMSLLADVYKAHPELIK
jgi:ABC-type nitrate/sulfonate/bicarbonate transport system substrate-binding protein